LKIGDFALTGPVDPKIFVRRGHPPPTILLLSYIILFMWRFFIFRNDGNIKKVIKHTKRDKTKIVNKTFLHVWFIGPCYTIGSGLAVSTFADNGVHRPNSFQFNAEHRLFYNTEASFS